MTRVLLVLLGKELVFHLLCRNFLHLWKNVQRLCSSSRYAFRICNGSDCTRHEVATGIEVHLSDINSSLDGIEASTEESSRGIADASDCIDELVRNIEGISAEVKK